ncbi:unnamed protein product [Calypogeia fissa]
MRGMDDPYGLETAQNGIGDRGCFGGTRDPVFPRASPVEEEEKRGNELRAGERSGLYVRNHLDSFLHDRANILVAMSLGAVVVEVAGPSRAAAPPPRLFCG